MENFLVFFFGWFLVWDYCYFQVKVYYRKETQQATSEAEQTVGGRTQLIE